MRRFKLHTGKAKVYDLTKEIYLSETKKDAHYSITGKDGCKRNFAVCPACDNPIQILGLYKKLANTDKPYGKHYNHSITIATHNETTYRLCPYAGHYYNVTRESRKEKVTEYERTVYHSARENFDLAMYILEQDTGIYITENIARQMLREYVASEAHMYYWATLYNIPWMFLYFMTAHSCYGLIIKQDCELEKYLLTREDVNLVPCDFKKGYVRVSNNGSFLDLNYTMLSHSRKVVNDEVVEKIYLELYSTDINGEFVTEYKQELQINEYRFPNLICNAKYRNQKRIELAREIMPEM